MEDFLRAMKELDIHNACRPYVLDGVHALSANTPQDSGLASSSWGYMIDARGDSLTIVWTNNNVENGFPVAIMLQYGYATGTGGYVQGRDYINPAIRPIFDRISDAVWKVVTSA